MKLPTLWLVLAGVEGLSLAALPVFSEEVPRQDAVASAEASSPASLHEAWMKAVAEERDQDARNLSAQYVHALTQQANRGNTDAMVELGKFFSAGSPAYPRNLEEARSWFEKAAQLGHADSQYHLAFMYQHGQGGEKDEAKAMQWFFESRKNMEVRASQGDAEGAFWVGMMYFKGEGTQEDKKLAFDWMIKAADMGSKVAPSLLAYMYRDGLGTDRSPESAFKWFLKSAEQGRPDAMMETALAYKNGIGVESNLEQARHWFSRAAELKNPYALRELASLLKSGEGGEKNLPQARAYFIQAASYGEPWSAVEASRMILEEDNDVSDDDVKQARALLFTAADRFRSPLGQHELGLFDWTHGDKESGVYWTRMAATAGYAPAMERMGKLSLIPFSGVTWNPVAAWQWWDAAAKSGNTDARAQANWLLWGGGAFLLIAITSFLLWVNRWINRKWAAEEK